MTFYKLFLFPLFCQTLLICTLFSSESDKGYTIIDDSPTPPILTPSFAERKTLKIRLDNGLEAIIISDPAIDKSSAGLVVKTGNWEDPEEHQGMAHFLEHMLFLGTEKFPDEAEYSRYMSEHGGLVNAFTSSDFTGYIFTIDNDFFSQALDRFSYFFKKPLFNRSGVEREVQAIDQEFAKNIENDDIREYFIHKELANPQHPFHAFGMGNKTSLKNTSQQALKEWYKEHYSANLMRLLVISNLGLAEIETLVLKDFKDIPNTHRHSYVVNAPIIPEDLKGKMVYIEPLKNIQKLTLIWELPPKFAEMRQTKPEKLISLVIGDEGEKSLLATLKKEKLATELLSYGEIVGGNNMEFQIEITLTELGVKKVNTVISRVFETIAGLKKTGIPRYIFEEAKSLAKINYEYQTQKDAFENIFTQTFQLANEEVSSYPVQTLLMDKFDPVAIKEILSHLTPDQAVYDLIAPKSLVNVAFDHHEKWLGGAYTVKEIPQDQLKAWSNVVPNSAIGLSAPNVFIPQSLAIHGDHKIEQNNDFSSLPHPDIILDDEKGKIYFAQDFIYLLPTVSWIFNIKSPLIVPNNVESIVLTELFADYTTEALNSYAYPATLAELNFAIAQKNDEITLSIDGYNDKALQLLKGIIKEFKEPQLRENRFKIIKDSLLRAYQDRQVDTPLVQAQEVLKSVIRKNFNSAKNKANALRKITFEKFEKFAQSLFKQAFIEGTLYGNMDKKQADDVSKTVISTLDFEPFLKENHYQNEVIVLPQDKGPYFIDVKNKGQGNAVILAIESLPFSFQSQAAQKILIQSIKEPFFTELRTKQQTGYIVLSLAEEKERHLFNFFAVQSNSHDPRDLLSRFELFIEKFIQELQSNGLPAENYNSIRNALLQEEKQLPKTISEMTELLDKLAFTYEGDFDFKNKSIKGFEELTYANFLKEALNSLGKQNKRRVAILLKGQIPEGSTLQYKRICGVPQLQKLSRYESVEADQN